MFTSLARNIVISGVAYSVISLVGLVLAPFLIGAYGLAGYGQILLARLFLPSASFAFLDLGVAESATRTVATARHDGDWRKAAQVLSLLAAMTLLVSALTAIFIAATAWRWPEWLSIDVEQRAGFSQLMLLTAAFQPVLFLSLVFEGVLKGFEQFKRLRACEIASALVYGGLAVGVAASGWGPNWVAATLLGGLFVRFILASAWAIPELRRHGVRLTRWSREARDDTLGWSRVMLANKSLGTLQAQIASPLIGLLMGPAAVGAFDTAVRVPRFAKSIFALLSTTVLPLAAGLKAKADSAALRRLGAYGILAALVISVPPLTFAMAYSHSILAFWIGDPASGFWGWQSAMFVVVILNIAISFGGAILLADRAAATALNRLTLWQVLLQTGLSLALAPAFDQWAFVLGQVASVALVFPFQFALIRRSLATGDRLLIQFVALVAVAGALALALRLAIPAPGLIGLIILMCGYLGVTWLGLTWVVLDRSERDLLIGRARELVGWGKSVPAGSPLGATDGVPRADLPAAAPAKE